MKWDDENYVKVYECARAQMSDNAIAGALGCSAATFQRWKDKYPAVVTAIRKGRKNTRKDTQSFRDFVYTRLPKRLRKVWRRIDRFDNTTNGTERIESLLADHGTPARQHLFLYALLHSNYSLSEALRKVNISYQRLQAWKEDPDFLNLVDEIQGAKKDFFESALVKLVKRGDTNAVVFANRTLNKDRGYSEKLDISVNGSINHNHHFVVDVDKLNLPFETRKEVWKAIKQEQDNTVDAKRIEGEITKEQVA